MEGQSQAEKRKADALLEIEAPSKRIRPWLQSTSQGSTQAPLRRKADVLPEDGAPMRNNIRPGLEDADHFPFTTARPAGFPELHPIGGHETASMLNCSHDLRPYIKIHSQDELCRLLPLEWDSYSRTTSQQFPQPIWQARAFAIDWLSRVCMDYRLTKEIFYEAVDLMDRYIIFSRLHDETEVWITCMAGLLLRAKCHSLPQPTVEQLSQYRGDYVTAGDIMDRQCRIYTVLRGNLEPLSLYSRVRYYLDPTYQHGLLPRTHAADQGPRMQFSGLFFSRIMQLLNLCILDIECLQFSYSQLAAAAIAQLVDPSVACQVTGCLWDLVEPCVSWMSRHVLALQQSSRASCISLPDVPAQAIHGIQVHNVGLDILDLAERIKTERYRN